MKNLFLPLLYCSSILWITSCATGKLYRNAGTSLDASPIEKADFTIFGVGDAGEINAQSQAVMKHLAGLSGDVEQRSLILFLGDNIYPAGMPPVSDIDGHQLSQDILMNQIFGFSSYPGRLYFLPGNHDWNEFHPGGLAAVKRQGAFLDSLHDPRISMIPRNGCPGPVTYDLTEDLVLVIFDSQWWIQDWADEAGINEGCEVDHRDDFLNAFRDVILRNSEKQLVIAMHHPLRTQGMHGGHFTFTDHLFPLTKVVPWLYLPLPVLGSIYPLYRSIIGHPQDLAHPAYSSLSDAVLQCVKTESDVIFLSGHDHSLQYITDDHLHFVISGSGAKSNAVANHEDLIYGHKAAGFVRLDYYHNKGVRLSVYEVDTVNDALDMVFSQFIVEKQKP